MSKDAVQFVLSHLMNDPEFRKHFDVNREEHLKNLPLTDAERAALLGLNIEELLKTTTHLKDMTAATVGAIYI